MSLWRWFSRKHKADDELKKAKERIDQLEREYRSLALTLQNLQSAIVAISRNQDVVVNDVRYIQEMVAGVVQEFAGADQLMFGHPQNSSKDDN